MVRVFLVAGIFILFFVFSSSLQAETFKWVDDDGKEHFTDQPLKGKNYEWVEDDEKTYFSYHPAEESPNGKAPGFSSGYAPSKTSRQQKKVQPGLNQTPTSGVSVSSPPPQQTSLERSFTRQTSTPRTSGTRVSGGRTSSRRY